MSFAVTSQFLSHKFPFRSLLKVHLFDFQTAAIEKEFSAASSTHSVGKVTNNRNSKPSPANKNDALWYTVFPY